MLKTIFTVDGGVFENTSLIDFIQTFWSDPLLLSSFNDKIKLFLRRNSNLLCGYDIKIR